MTGTITEEKEDEVVPDQLSKEEDEEDEVEVEESNDQCQDRSDQNCTRTIVDVREKRYIVREDFVSDSKEYSSKGKTSGPHSMMTVHTTDDYGYGDDYDGSTHHDDDKYDYDDSEMEREFDEFMKYIRNKMDGYDNYMKMRRRYGGGNDPKTHHDFTEDIYSWTRLDDRKADQSDDEALEDYDGAYDYDFDWEEETQPQSKSSKTNMKKDKHPEYGYYY